MAQDGHTSQGRDTVKERGSTQQGYINQLEEEQTANPMAKASNQYSKGQDRPEHGDWEAMSGWTYMGHGDWAASEETITGETNQVNWDPGWICNWRCTVDKDLELHRQVISKGYPNRWGARRPVKTKWNLEVFQEKLKDYEDKEVVEWLTYGWPAGRLPSLADPAITASNHKGATEHPEALNNYIIKEQKHGAVMGPYESIPFQGKVGISPLSSRPKKDSQECRIILDLSFPSGQSINDGIMKDNYLGFPAKLTFPKVNDFALRIYTLGKDCMMFKVHVSRYFRQLPLDPGDYSLIGYIIQGKIYFDKVLSMGLRSTPYIAESHKCHCLYTQTDAILPPQLCE